MDDLTDGHSDKLGIVVDGVAVALVVVDLTFLGRHLFGDD